MKRCLLPALALLSCAGPSSTQPTAAPTAKAAASTTAPTAAALPEEVRLGDLRQLSFGGENAEAYWSFDGKQLSLQARHEGMDCDRIYRLALDPSSAQPSTPIPVSSGKGATTCSHFV